MLGAEIARDRFTPVEKPRRGFKPSSEELFLTTSSAFPQKKAKESNKNLPGIILPLVYTESNIPVSFVKTPVRPEALSAGPPPLPLPLHRVLAFVTGDTLLLVLCPLPLLPW